MRASHLIALAAIAITVSSAPARADRLDDHGGAGTVIGFGLGPPARFSGALGERFQPTGVSGRIRFGGRVGRAGFELVTSVVNLEGGDLDYPAMIIATPTLAYYPVARSHLQLALRTGIGYGSLGGDRPGPPPPCRVEPPCPGPETLHISYAGYAVELGATLQLHLGRRKGGRAILWADLGVSFTRFQLPDQVVGGKLVILTFGWAHGMEF